MTYLNAKYKYWTWIFVAMFILLIGKPSHAAITDAKFSTAQIFDVQWYVSGGVLYASGFNYIYSSINYSTQTASAARWTAAQTSDAGSNGRYIAFFNSTTNPGTYGMAVYNSDGTVYKIINNTGSFHSLSDGAIFYNGNGMWGTLITTKQGYNIGQSANFTITTLNPTNAQLQAYTPQSSTPLAAGQTATTTPTPNWQMIRTNSSPVVINNIYPTSYNSPAGEGAANAFDGNVNTKYLNFDKKNAGVTVKLSQGRVVQKFTITTANDFSGRDPTSYKLYGSNDGVTWTLIKQDSLSLSENRFWTSPEIPVANTTAYVYYFILFPTTKSGDGCGLNCDSMQIAEVTFYYDLNDGITSTETGSGGTPANPGQAGSVCSDCFSSNITAAQQALLDAARTRRNAIGLGNRIDLYSDGSGNSVTIEQTGNYNRVQGLGGAGTNAHVAGFGTAVDIKQGDTLSGRNLIELRVQGNGNNVTISQARNTTTGAQDGAESGGHISRVSITGDVGTYIFRQGNDGGTNSGHFLNYTMSGSGGTHRVTQSNNGEKLAFISITGNNNNETILQSGTGNHFLDLTMTGNGNSANITQTGAGSHKATINLANVGGASSLTLLQQGSTNQVYSITQQCANLSGCSVSVTQGGGG
jgi:hypothetical protein